MGRLLAGQLEETAADAEPDQKPDRNAVLSSVECDGVKDVRRNREADAHDENRSEENDQQTTHCDIRLSFRWFCTVTRWEAVQCNNRETTATTR